MRLGSDEDAAAAPGTGSRRSEASAYPEQAPWLGGEGARFGRFGLMVSAGLFLFMLARATLARDYRSDAESYLRSVGREHTLDTVMPLSVEETRQEEVDVKTTLLALMEKNKELESRIEGLEARSQGKNSGAPAR